MTNQLNAVQLLSVFNYLNVLSDFLFLENYLAADDQYKQIPVVNALYECLEENHDNQELKVKLIRILLQGSDLYGEKEDENLDETFVNSMFEYIISSLVFNKYGNIYGFLADIVRRAPSKNVNDLQDEILKTLTTAKFQNEYGEKSILTVEAAERIYKDLILPLFPNAESNVDVLSLDYMYAQAGSIFLRTGASNTVYYQNLNKNRITVSNQNISFDEYVTIGHILKNSLHHENIRFASYKAFTLPALFHYVTTVFLANEEIRTVVFDPPSWKAIYELFQTYLDEKLNKIRRRLEYDTRYQIHSALSNFKNRFTIAKSILEEECNLPDSNLEQKEKIQQYLLFPELTKCEGGRLLPNLTKLFMDNVESVSEAYKKHDIKSMQRSFGLDLLRILKYTEVTIQLLAPDDKVVRGVFDSSERIPYDLFVFYYPENSTADFYALMREDCSSTLIKESDDPEGFQIKTGLNVQMLLSHRFHRINLKSSEQTMQTFWENLITYKQQRLKSYLIFSSGRQTLGEWWKEFGVTTIPLYTCLQPTNEKSLKEKVCLMDEVNFSQQWTEEVSTILTDRDTRTLLNSLGTTFNSVQIFSILNQTYPPIKESTDIYDVMEKFVLHFGDPGFELTFMKDKDLILILKVLNTLKKNINESFLLVKNIINNMIFLKTRNSKSISYAGVESQNLIVKTEDIHGDTGFGYRYKYFSINQIAELRTNYQNKKQIFVTLVNDSVSEKLYVNSDNFTSLMYETNNHLKPISTKVLFSGLSVNAFNYKKCEMQTYIEHSVPLIGCRRYSRTLERDNDLISCVKLASSRNANLSSDIVLETMEKYIFPSDLDHQFILDWTNTTELKIPEWSKEYLITYYPLFSKLRNNFDLDVKNLSNFDGALKIDSLYTFKERQQLESEINVQTMTQSFNDQHARYVARFEDYYAIQNFATTGYTRITEDTSEARMMKKSLYKLAIRQSDDPSKEFNRILYRVESKSIQIIEKTIQFSRNITFKKFTPTFDDRETAIKLAPFPAIGFKNILYEIHFFTNYVRAKILKHFKIQIEEVILLPGSKFDITEYKETKIEGLGNILFLKLQYLREDNDKFKWYRNIMNEIQSINTE